jgi:hypothetical protein
MIKVKEITVNKEFYYCDRCGGEIGEISDVIIFKSMLIGPGCNPHIEIDSCDGCKEEILKMFVNNPTVKRFYLGNIL